jgi:methionine-rich copper-binding protein CopC
VLAVAAGALLGLLLGLAGPSAAQAHADLVGSAPANGDHLDVAPAEIRLRFSERITLAGDGVTVTDVSGARRSTEPARPDPAG